LQLGERRLVERDAVGDNGHAAYFRIRAGKGKARTLRGALEGTRRTLRKSPVSVGRPRVALA
jgi:hypothetical protein